MALMLIRLPPPSPLVFVWKVFFVLTVVELVLWIFLVLIELGSGCSCWSQIAGDVVFNDASAEGLPKLRRWRLGFLSSAITDRCEG